jgi:hypothetical protein
VNFRGIFQSFNDQVITLSDRSEKKITDGLIKSTLLIGYATGKKTTRSIRTIGDMAAPTANPYREHTAWGMI